MWTSAGVTLAFVLTRPGVCLRIGGKLARDDVRVVLAWLMLLRTADFWTIFRLSGFTTMLPRMTGTCYG
jgi:hypothetical protein